MPLPYRVVARSDGTLSASSMWQCWPGSSCAKAACSTASATSGLSAGGVSLTDAASAYPLASKPALRSAMTLLCRLGSGVNTALSVIFHAPS